MSFNQRYLFTLDDLYFLYMCLLKLSKSLFRRSEEKANSCELRYYFVNYVNISSITTVNSGTVA